MRRRIWDSMLDADMNERYWGCLSRRYSKRNKYSKIFLAVMSSGTVASWAFWSEVEVLWKVLSGLSALVAIALPFFDWESMVEKTSVIRGKWLELKSEYENLWSKLKSCDADIDEIENIYNHIGMKHLNITKEETELPHDEKLLTRCVKEVTKSRGLS